MKTQSIKRRSRVSWALRGIRDPVHITPSAVTLHPATASGATLLNMGVDSLRFPKRLFLLFPDFKTG
ncbi:unnamed protein product [Boreogadus saida]